MRLKKLAAGMMALSMTLTAFAGMSVISEAAEMNPPSKLVSVCYSPELDLYTAVAAKSTDSGNNLIVYSSGDGKSWVRSAAEINDANTRIGAIEANGYYVNPNMIVWNEKEHMFVMGDMANVYTSIDGISWTKLGTPKKYANPDGTGTASNIELYNMYFDGTEYWATTRINEEVARTIDGNPLKWYAAKLNADNKKAVAAITGTDSGKIYASSAINDQGAYVTKDNGRSWDLAIGANVGPFKTLGSVYSKFVDRLILVGINGNKNDLTSASTAAINLIDPATDKAPEGNKLELKSIGADRQTPGPAGDVTVSEDGSEIIIAFMNGDLYMVDLKSDEEGSEGQPSVGRARDVANYVKIKPRTEADDIGTMPLTGIARGKNGYVAIGGTPGHKSTINLVEAGGGAVFIPNDTAQGYEKAVFYTNDTVPQAATAFIGGEADEIAIESVSNTAQYSVTVRDQSGAPMEGTGKRFHWSIKGNPAGVSVSDGLVSVEPHAQPGYVTLEVQEDNGSLKADRRILLTAEPVPASVEVNGNDRILVKKKTGGREYSYTAAVKDQLGRTMDAEAVTWRIDALEGGGVTVDENGTVTIQPEAQNGSFLLTAVSKTDPAVEGSLTLTVTGIGEVVLSGPAEMVNIKKLLADSLDTAGSGLSRNYTYSPIFKDSEGNQISGESCTYTIKGAQDYSADGVTLSRNTAGGAVITVAPDTITQNLTLVAAADNNDDVVGTYELHIVKSLVEDSGFRRGVGEGSGWTVIDGKVTPGSSGGLALMRMNAAEGEEAIANSDSFAVTAGQTYAFGFRSKVSDGMNYNSSMYAMLLFCNSDGEPIDFADVYDTNIEGKKDSEQPSAAINGHQTGMEYYSLATAPEGAVSAYVMLGVTGPIKNADFYDIGVYPTDEVLEEPRVYAKSITVSDRVTAGESVQAQAVVANTTDENSEAVLIVAVYDADNVLKEIAVSGKTTVSAKDDTMISVSGDIDAAADTAGWTAKAFLWSSLNSMRPILN